MDAILVGRAADTSYEATIISQYPYVAKQLAGIDDRRLRTEIERAGYWKDCNLEDRDHNERRIVWLACRMIFDRQPKGY